MRGNDYGHARSPCLPVVATVKSMHIRSLAWAVAVAVGLLGCGATVDPEPAEPQFGGGQQWDRCDADHGCFAGSGLSCFGIVCTFECVDRLKVDQCASVGGECGAPLGAEGVTTCQMAK